MNYLKDVDDRQLFQKMMLDYVIELSAYNPNITTENADVLANELTNKMLDELHSYFILWNGHIAGFVSVGDGGKHEAQHNIEEFYVLPQYRRNGVGSMALCEVFMLYKGVYYLHILKKNRTAKRFWKREMQKRSIKYSIGSDSAIAHYMIFGI